jgi:hypothetical protein
MISKETARRISEEIKGKKILLIHVSTITVAELYIQRVTMK